MNYTQSEAPAFRFTDENEIKLCCPDLECNNTILYPVEVTVCPDHTGQNIITINNNGLLINRTFDPLSNGLFKTNNSGVAIALGFFCESCGHIFVLVYEYDKNHVIYRIYRSNHITEPIPAELWRD